MYSWRYSRISLLFQTVWHDICVTYLMLFHCFRQAIKRAFHLSPFVLFQTNQFIIILISTLWPCVPAKMSQSECINNTAFRQNNTCTGFSGLVHWVWRRTCTLFLASFFAVCVYPDRLWLWQWCLAEQWGLFVGLACIFLKKRLPIVKITLNGI